MVREIKIYHVDGDLMCTRKFSGEPQVGDRLFVSNKLAEIYSRRWTDTGELELIVHFELM
jgi:hypothetical protein